MTGCKTQEISLLFPTNIIQVHCTILGIFIIQHGHVVLVTETNDKDHLVVQIYGFIYVLFHLFYWFFTELIIIWVFSVISSLMMCNEFSLLDQMVWLFVVICCYHLRFIRQQSVDFWHGGSADGMKIPLIEKKVRTQFLAHLR